MATVAEPRVELIASTTFYGNPLLDVDDDASHSGALTEFAGRACYQSWSKPNPETAHAHGYVGNILAHGHGSVLEHSTVTFYISGVSRSLTHELIRHRHLSFSELSQRFVNVSGQGIVVPPMMDGDGPCVEVLHEAWDAAADDYTVLVEEQELGIDPEITGRMRRKRAREAARAVLPQMCETRIVVTGNLRAWRGFLISRGSVQADAEIQRLAVLVWEQLRDECPEAFQDFYIDGDGALVARYGRV